MSVKGGHRGFKGFEFRLEFAARKLSGPVVQIIGGSIYSNSLLMGKEEEPFSVRFGWKLCETVNY